MSPWQEHCEGKKDLESFVRNVEEFAESLYTIIADRAGKRIHISFTDVRSKLSGMARTSCDPLHQQHTLLPL